MTKTEALAKHLECTADELNETKYDGIIEYSRHEYLVLTDDEADEKTKENILDSLWAFRASFVAGHCGNMDLEEAIQALQEKLCEDANEPIKRLLGDNLEDFIEDAVRSDGRGHFLAGYDHEEIELDGDLYAYRTN